MNSSRGNLSDWPLNVSLEHCSLSLAQGVSLVITNVMVCVLGTLGNLLVCVAIATTPHLRRSSNYILFSLAIADLIVTIASEPFLVAIISKITFYNACATKLELLYIIFSRLSCSASIAHMAIISLDRLLAVVFPLRHKIIMNDFGLKTMLIVSWVLPTVISTLSGVLPASFSRDFLSTGSFVLGYFIVILSYSLVVVFLFKVKKKRRQLNARPLSTGIQSREVRVAVTLAIVAGIFTVCWLPLMIAFFVPGKLLLKPNGPAHMWLRTLALSNSAMNFFIYSARIREFHNAYVTIFRKLSRLVRVNSGTT